MTTTQNKSGWANLEQTIAEAKYIAQQHGVKAFVYQTGPEQFNFRFCEHSETCGVLVARIDENGNSI